MSSSLTRKHNRDKKLQKTNRDNNKLLMEVTELEVTLIRAIELGTVYHDELEALKKDSYFITKTEFILLTDKMKVMFTECKTQLLEDDGTDSGVTLDEQGYKNMAGGMSVVLRRIAQLNGLDIGEKEVGEDDSTT